MNWTGYVISLLFSTFTGWLVAWAAVKMIFHPAKPVRLFGLTIQGVFPKNQQLIAEKLGQVVSKEFLSFSELEKKVTNPENLEKLKPEIEAHIDNFLNSKLKEVFPMLSMFIGEKTTNQLKGAFLLELESLFPVLMKGYMAKLQNDLDLEKMVTEKVAGFSPGKVEKTLYQLAKKELRLFELFGALLGLVVGIVEVLVAILVK